MGYNKMTPDDFIQKLGNGGYADRTAARRALGKAGFSDSGKNKCYAAVDAKFPEGSAPASKSAKKKAAKKNKSAKTAKKAPAAKGAKGKATAKAKPAQKRNPKPRRTPAPVEADESTQALQKIHLAKERVGTIMQTIEAMKAAKEVHSDLDLSGPAQRAARALDGVLEDVHSSVVEETQSSESNGAVDPAVLEQLTKTAPASVGLPGQPSPVQVPTEPMS